jgi:hypothetical protein
MPLTILLVPLPQIHPISTIFVVVPYVIIMAFPIIIPPFAMVVIVGSYHHRGDEGHAHQ